MDSTQLIVQFAGWVALLLWGVRMVRTGITRSFTGRVRSLVAFGARNSATAAGIGLLVAILLQSSTATGLIVSSLVLREIVTLGTALSVMLGADVGTAIAAFIFSVRIVWLAPLLIALGVFTFLGTRDDRRRSLARISIGLGLTLLSLQLIGSAAAILRQSAGFATTLTLLDGQPLLAFLLGAGVTWLAHSSLSTVILVMSLAGADIVTLPLALALVLGANVGGSLAPYVDQLAAPNPGRRVMLGNLLMRGSVAVVVLAGLLPSASWLLRPLHAASAAHAVLLFHVAFNLVTALSLLPFTGFVARLCRSLLPDAPAADDVGQPRYLDASVLDSPTEALASATRETLALGDLVSGMLEQSLAVFERDDSRLMKQIEKMDDAVDTRHEAIKLYLMKVSSAGLSDEDSRRFVEILTFITNLEHIGDIIDKNLMELAAKKIRNKLAFSREGLDELRQFHGRVRDNLNLAFNVFTLRDVRLARKLLNEKPLLREQEVFTANSHFERLRAGRPESIETSAIHLDIIRDLKRINSHLTSVAYPILEAAGELLTSRLRQQQDGEAPAIRHMQ
jgi:phosphate:Na+ symporter